jgi:hypothetical protein
MSLSITRRNQLHELLQNLFSTTYARLGLRDKAEEKLKKTSIWKKREEAREKAERVVWEANKYLIKVEDALEKIAKSLGEASEEDDYELREKGKSIGAGVGVSVKVERINNPVSPLAITEDEGSMVLHYGTNGRWVNGREKRLPKNPLIKEPIGSPQLLALISDLKMEFTAALTEKDILAVLTRAKTELGAFK